LLLADSRTAAARESRVFQRCPSPLPMTLDSPSCGRSSARSDGDRPEQLARCTIGSRCASDVLRMVCKRACASIQETHRTAAWSLFHPAPSHACMQPPRTHA
jgi:hypothetical protein